MSIHKYSYIYTYKLCVPSHPLTFHQDGPEYVVEENEIKKQIQTKTKTKRPKCIEYLRSRCPPLLCKNCSDVGI